MHKNYKSEIIYNFSRCYCKIVVCRYVDSLVCRLRIIMLRSEYLRSLSVRSCSVWKFCYSKISLFLFGTFVVLITILGPFMLAVTNYARAVYA